MVSGSDMYYSSEGSPAGAQAAARIKQLEERVAGLEGELQALNEEYRATNERLRSLNARYQEKILELTVYNNDMNNFFDNANIGTVFLDTSLCIKRFTPCIAKELNLKEQDIGKPLKDISHNLIDNELCELAADVAKSMISSDKEVRSRTGCWYLQKCAPCIAPDNTCKGVIILLMDITRRKRAEICHAKIGEMYEKLVEFSPFAIYIIQNGKFHFSNSAGLKLLNISRENELILVPFRYFFNVDEEKLITVEDSSLPGQGKTMVPIEDKIVLADGNELLVEISAISVFVDGKPAKLLFVRDISFRIEEERLREENEKSKKLLNETILSETLKTEFFSNLSHELRTPLNVILSTLQLLELYARDSDIRTIESKLKRYVKIMKQNCYRQLRLVNNMIDITKLDAGFFELNLQNCDIVSLVENITLSVSEYIKNKFLDLIFDTDLKEFIVACDPDKVERVILNLLSNSIKFTKEGGSMTVSMHITEGSVAISIKDTGIGIPGDKIGIIFDRFRQVDKSLTRKQEGSGIGLSIVKSLVELHGGEVSVNSEYGKGTEFVVRLPIRVLNADDCACKAVEEVSQERIERIHIEFSDIYSLV
ncbi:MAG TPA: ATP-binding protein [Clostridia bacterium]|nr:ATP-binding protein [Clostridia bacterium]